MPRGNPRRTVRKVKMTGQESYLADSVRERRYMQSTPDTIESVMTFSAFMRTLIKEEAERLGMDTSRIASA